jgi:methylthioribose-1-phosphate isomerase
MAGHLMSRGEVDLVIVGADRIAANGDTANKIGTYTLAVLAQRHGLPFYVAAPLSTFDAKTADGAHIPIEERAASEMTGYRAQRWAPEAVAVKNPAFDVTPAELITAIICEKMVVRSPNRERLQPLISTSA